MKTITMPGISTPVSALCLGTADLPDFDAAAPVYDAFIEAGGNLFDTAWIYGLGRAERIFGEWLQKRGNRNEFLVIGKGAHTPECTPDAIQRQLRQSLDRLATDYLDIYMMHRDDTDVPVGEFVGSITAEVQAGRITHYGFSNWSLERFDAAIDYAESNDLARPVALSNNFSLAEMVEPVWAGCVHASDETSKTRLERGDVGLYAWSAQARGFFARTDNDPELIRCWHSPKNQMRKNRAQKLAAQHRVNGNTIALAYCLNQTFPVVPLIGPLHAEELSDSLRATGIKLTADNIAWLEA